MEWFKKMWRFVKLYVSKYYIAFLSGGVVWMLLDVYAIKGIDASFVSAIADTSLVVFAFIALLEAKKEWDKRLKQDGYKIASDLMNDKFIKIVQVTSDLIGRVRGVENTILSIVNKLPPENSNLKDYEGMRILVMVNSNLKPRLENLSEQVESLQIEIYEKLFPLSQEVQFTILRMRNNSVDFSGNDSGDLLKSHYTDFSTLTIQCENCYVAINQYLYCMKMSKNPFAECDGFNIGAHNYEHLNDIIEIKSYIDEIKKLIRKIRENLNIITLAAKDKKTMVDYFDLN
ncbi:hypothetical protein ACKURH_16000 [Enterobacter soli]